MIRRLYDTITSLASLARFSVTIRCEDGKTIVSSAHGPYKFELRPGDRARVFLWQIGGDMFRHAVMKWTKTDREPPGIEPVPTVRKIVPSRPASADGGTGATTLEKDTLDRVVFDFSEPNEIADNVPEAELRRLRSWVDCKMYARRMMPGETEQVLDTAADALMIRHNAHYGRIPTREVKP